MITNRCSIFFFLRWVSLICWSPNRIFFHLSQHCLNKHPSLLITSRTPRLSYDAFLLNLCYQPNILSYQLPCFMINQLASMALLWFPLVGLDHYSNPLEQLRLQFMLITWLLTSWDVPCCNWDFNSCLSLDYLILIILDLG
jgi:hypothetical protein